MRIVNKEFEMSYAAKPIGTGAGGGGLTILGVQLGYGWLIVGTLLTTGLIILAIRWFFKPGTIFPG